MPNPTTLRIAPPPETRDLGRAEAVAVFRRFLQLQDRRIQMRHQAGAGGIEVAGARARVFDLVLERIFDEALAAPGQVAKPCQRVAVVAVGGYGRGLLNPHSDVDLLFLYEGRQPGPRLLEVVNDILYRLWDLGLKLGHAVRTIPETIRQALEDFQTLSALIESRCVAGDRKFHDDFHKRFRKQCVAGRQDAYLKNRLDDLAERHSKHLGTVYVQEPNVKLGVGGLRDFHNIIWLSYVKFGTTDPEQLVARGLLTASAWKELHRAYDFVLRVRNHLHFLEKRARDVLTLHLQGVVATDFHYPQRSILRRCEAFMRDYYHHTSVIRRVTSQAIESLEIESQRRQRNHGFIPFLPRKRPRREEFDGFYAEDGRCHPLHPRVFEEDPARLMRCFQHAQLRHLRLAPSLKDLVTASFHLVNKAFRYNKAVRQTFEAILSRKGDVGWTLRQMHQIGFLGRFLPEFDALDCLVQHEFFHRYTADEHTLRTIEALDALADTGDPGSQKLRLLLQEIEDPGVLYLALVMHDTGRAENTSHHEDASTLLASRVCSRLQIKEDRRRLLLFLVDHHLTFWKTATTKNLEDPDTITEFASIIRHEDTLKYLYLLSYADAMGTAADSWNGWKASLMGQLFDQTAGFLADQEAFRQRMRMGRSAVRGEVAKRLPASYAEEIDVHFQLMPARYFKTRQAEAIASDLRVFRAFFENLREDGTACLVPMVKWEALPDEGCSRVTVVSWDRPLLLARITACCAARNLNILAADIFTRGDDLALDQFRVCTTNWEPVAEERTLKRFHHDLERVFVTSEPDLDALMADAVTKRTGPDPRLPTFPMRVFISNETDPECTFVEIQALDRIGLLFDVFRTVARHGLEVHHARINTTKGAAIDSFYLTTPDGHQMTDPTALRDFHRAMEEAIGVTPAGEEPEGIGG